MTNQEQADFKSQVFLILSSSSMGEVFSYGELAKRAGAPRHARYVGRILRDLPRDTQLPWYRVVNSKRMISFTENSEPYLRQKQLLEQEGWIVTGQKLFIRD